MFPWRRSADVYIEESEQSGNSGSEETNMLSPGLCRRQRKNTTWWLFYIRWIVSSKYGDGGGSAENNTALLNIGMQTCGEIRRGKWSVTVAKPQVPPGTLKKCCPAVIGQRMRWPSTSQGEPTPASQCEPTSSCHQFPCRCSSSGQSSGKILLPVDLSLNMRSPASSDMDVLYRSSHLKALNPPNGNSKTQHL